MDEAERHAQGLRVRRAVLGEAHVDRAVAQTTPLTEAFQDLITRYAWGEVWSRPALPHETRRLLTLAMLIARGMREEFRMHVRAALEHDTPLELIREVVLQSAIYCGVPAANTAFHDVAAVMAELSGASSQAAAERSEQRTVLSRPLADEAASPGSAGS